MIKKLLFLGTMFLCRNLQSSAQDLIDLLPDTAPVEKSFTSATFKTTRIINTQTLETLGKRTLDFRISHRFGTLNSGAYNLWGIDGPANIRLGLEYSYDGRLMAGIGRSSYEKMWDGFLKYRLYRQTDDNTQPLSITLFSGMYYTNQKDPNKEINGYDKYEYTSSRMSYAFEIIAGRKFSNALSFQLAPFLVHYNLVDNFTDKNDVYGITVAGRYKFTKRSSVTFEYSHCINEYTQESFYDSFGIGYELETGGHVFQVHLTNSFGIVENQFFAHTNTQWNDAGIRVGFNISRVFRI